MALYLMELIDAGTLLLWARMAKPLSVASMLVTL